MDTRGKYGAQTTSQHQPLFKPIHSAVDKYPTKGNLGTASNSIPSGSHQHHHHTTSNNQYNQFNKQQ